VTARPIPKDDDEVQLYPEEGRLLANECGSYRVPCSSNRIKDVQNL
jgi:hypothetical protein